MTQPKVTRKELDIILLICKEYNTVEIADKLGIGKRTVESYRASILKKIKARNTAGVIIYAIKSGIFKVRDPRKVSTRPVIS